MDNELIKKIDKLITKDKLIWLHLLFKFDKVLSEVVETRRKDMRIDFKNSNQTKVTTRHT